MGEFVGGLIVALVPFVLSLIRLAVEKKRLPAVVMDAIDTIGEANIVNAVQTAAAMSDKSPAQKREFAVMQVNNYLNRQGITIPEGYTRMAIEWAYQRLKKGRLK